MHEVLVVYQQIEMQFDEDGNLIIPQDEPMIHTVSCDEKPGIQAIATTSDDLRPTAERGCVYYYRLRKLRQGIDGLSAVIRRQLGVDPFQKNVLFLCCGRKPDKIKCLIWEGDGFLLLYKRLLDGRYQWPRSKQEVMEMTQEQFEWLMSGQTILPSIRKAKPKNML